MMGNWEEVRRELGVEGLGLKMPENPYNSLEQFQGQMGIGVFSTRAIFAFDEIDHNAEHAYYEQAYKTFSKSAEAQRVVDRHGDLGWSGMLLEFGINYLGEIVDDMTLESVREFVLGHVPRKVSTEPDAAASIVCELALFWEYLDRVHGLPEAKLIAEWLKTDSLVAQLEAKLSNSSNFGMAKSMFMLGKNAGYDMTSEEGLVEFMTAYNRSLTSDKSPAAAAPVARAQRVGRNDPCPCGSGKKFKKCCR
ncbi:MAG: SEC-C domain-containing protein [Pirellulales bacterium]|nr:SEC-C domain-containing protein [Pirellulales bacterium]